MTQPASRFGSDAPARIQTTAVMLLEATSQLPEQVPAPVLIPFYPSWIVTGDEVAAALNPVMTDFEQHPTRLDIAFRQGDDVVIPIPIEDLVDMSAWEWVAQIRVLPYYTRTLVNEFTTSAEYFPPVEDEVLGTTLVRLFLPRELNDFRGKYYWEMYSIGPADFSDFPQPVDWPVDDVWPPTTTLKTWYYGLCTISSRTTDTDVLPDVDVDVIVPTLPDGWYPGYPGYFVGPNGRVP